MRLDAELVATGWLDIVGHHVDSMEYQNGCWAFDVISRSLEADADPEYCLNIIKNLVMRASSKDVTGAICAGIIQDFVTRFINDEHYLEKLSVIVIRNQGIIQMLRPSIFHFIPPENSQKFFQILTAEKLKRAQ